MATQQWVAASLRKGTPTDRIACADVYAAYEAHVPPEQRVSLDELTKYIFARVGGVVRTAPHDPAETRPCFVGVQWYTHVVGRDRTLHTLEGVMYAIRITECGVATASHALAVMQTRGAKPDDPTANRIRIDLATHRARLTHLHAMYERALHAHALACYPGIQS